MTSAISVALDDGRLTATFAALASSTRRAILARLADGSATVNELAEPFEMTLPAVSKHLKVLEHAGLISRSHQAQFRPCALETERLQEVLTWAEQYRHIWDSRFDQMDSYISQMQTPRGAKGNDDKRQ